MNNLITPPFEIVIINEKIYPNFAVNMDNVNGVKRTTYNISTAHGEYKEPIISFFGTDIIWHFGESSEAENSRNLIYDQIITVFGNQSWKSFISQF